MRADATTVAADGRGNREVLSSIQACRGIAALAVAAYHLSIAWGDPALYQYELLGALTWQGDLGVDFFFVLSGFIIMFAHAADIGHPARFVAYCQKRFIRVYPVYWLYLLVLIGLTLAGLGITGHLPRTPLQYLSNVSLVRFNAALPVLRPGWTLFHEVAFYAVFSTLLISRRAGLALFAAWQLIILWHFTYAAVEDRTPFNTYFSAFNLNFLLGIGSYVLWRRLDARASRCLLAVAGTVLLVTLIHEPADPGHTAVYRILFALCFAGLITGLASWESAKPRRIPYVLLLMGNASYSIYLAHETLEFWLLRLLKRLSAAAPAHDVLAYGVVLAATVALGCLLHLSIERPLIRGCRQLLRGSSARGRGPAHALSS